MRVKEAVRRADALRPNALGEERKAAWLLELEGRLRAMMGLPAPGWAWPEDGELAVPEPYDGVYERWLCAMTDLAVQDIQLYANDMALYNTAWAEVCAWWRRGHCPPRGENWRV